MSFSIDRYKEESRKLDTTGVDWADIPAHPLSRGDLYCLHYMMDIENHVPLYLSHLMVTRACMDPILTSFLAMWNYEELWHGENLGRFLHEYGIQFDTAERIGDIRANLGVSNTISLFTTMAGSWVLKDFAAIYLTIGAINELATATGYAALSRRSRHPVLQDLLSRIQKDERRHFAFYYNSAKEWLAGNRAAQRLDRFMLDRVWVPVGQGVKTQEQVDALALYLFDDEEGEQALLGIDEKIGKLPGLAGVRLMSKALEDARVRVRRRPGWATRVIDDEEWAISAPRHRSVREFTTRRTLGEGLEVLEGA